MTETRPTAVIVTSKSVTPRARWTVRALLSSGVPTYVVDCDGTWERLGSESLLTLGDLGSATGSADALAPASATLEPSDLTFHVGALTAHHLLASGSHSRVVVLAPGVVTQGDLSGLCPPDADLTVVTSTSAVENEPGAPVLARTVFGLTSGPAAARLVALSGDWKNTIHALDTTALLFGSVVLRDPSVLLAAERSPRAAGLAFDPLSGLTLDGRLVTAVDLSSFDPGLPWVVDRSRPTLPCLRLSEAPALREFIGSATQGDAAPVPDADTIAPLLRDELRREHDAGQPVPSLLAGLDEVRAWATDLVPERHARPVSRYLRAVRASRPDLIAAYPQVPGKDSAGLTEWARQHGRAAGIDLDLVPDAVVVPETRTRPAVVPASQRPDGVNLVGYLAGELGLGVSARLMDAALDLAKVPTSTFDVSGGLMHRTTAAFRATSDTAYNTTLICVNGPQWRGVLRQVRPVVRGTHRIGMWYWELEEFPESQRGGFGAVDEIWAPTDFIRDAIVAAQPGVPVHTVMPPLPQRDESAVVPALPERFGIGDRPYFLFTFDYLSLADRKNPLGLAEAFRRAFPTPTDDGPLLVIKTINGESAPADSERLRIETADRPDVRIIDEYLPNDERHVLVAHCAAYVSLHRAEGLGLTIAEAMAWGKPVITTFYGGPTQFVDEGNAFLVGWTPGTVQKTAGPYLAGTRWAEPDLDEAAALMRRVLEEPAAAAAKGAQAARDIRELHSMEVAGARIASLLADGFAARRAAAAASAGRAGRGRPLGPRVRRRVARLARRRTP